MTGAYPKMAVSVKLVSALVAGFSLLLLISGLLYRGIQSGNFSNVFDNTPVSDPVKNQAPLVRLSLASLVQTILARKPVLLAIVAFLICVASIMIAVVYSSSRDLSDDAVVLDKAEQVSHEEPFPWWGYLGVVFGLFCIIMLIVGSTYRVFFRRENYTLSGHLTAIRSQYEHIPLNFFTAQETDLNKFRTHIFIYDIDSPHFYTLPFTVFTAQQLDPLQVSAIVHKHSQLNLHNFVIDSSVHWGDNDIYYVRLIPIDVIDESKINQYKQMISSSLTVRSDNSVPMEEFHLRIESFLLFHRIVSGKMVNLEDCSATAKPGVDYADKIIFIDGAEALYCNDYVTILQQFLAGWRANFKAPYTDTNSVIDLLQVANVEKYREYTEELKLMYTDNCI